MRLFQIMGLAVTMTLACTTLRAQDAETIKTLYQEKYANEFVQYVETLDEGGLLSGLAVSGKDCMKVTVAGNDERILLIAGYDNLGKGASGAAIECMNMAIGTERTKGLVI
jgi:N-acetyl-gamma-glutamyl-phosphate reductase